MKKVCVIWLMLLFLWFSLDMIGLKVKDTIIVESAFKSDGVFWGIFLILLIIFILKDKVGKVILTIFLFLWLLTQYLSHWHYTIFGVTKEKLISYNTYFENTFHIIPSSNTILIPDFYHIVLHTLLLINFTLLIMFLFKQGRER